MAELCSSQLMASPGKPILVIGDGPAASTIARKLDECGCTVTVAQPEKDGDSLDSALVPADSGTTLLPDTRTVACYGSEGEFDIVLSTGGIQSRHRFAAVVIAMESIRRPNFDLYGLKPSPQIIALSSLNGDHTADRVSQIVFLAGLAHQTEPAIMSDVIRAATRLQTTTPAACYVLTDNVKVAAAGLEKQYLDCRSAGVAFIKPAGDPARFNLDNEGLPQITCLDATLQEEVQLTPELVVVDETILPSPYLANLIKIFELESDAVGFAQTGNVHRLPVSTNRPGILVAGPSRRQHTAGARAADIEAVVLAALRPQALAEAPAPQQPPARINAGLCISCLTCLRLCPYRAVTLAGRTLEISAACQACYLCTAECPRQAISGVETVEVKVPGVTADTQPEAPNDAYDPQIFIFGCRRSASPAAEMAAGLGFKFLPGISLVGVPCAGGIATAHILNAFEAGADGVLVFTCHDGNCHSETGNRHARRRVSALAAQLSAVGLDPRRLVLRSLAANMGPSFSHEISQFETILRRLGPTALVQQPVEA